MPNPQKMSPDDRITLDRLLSKLAGCLDGAIDFWTLVCLGTFTPDRRGFLQDHWETMHGLVLVTRALLQEAGLGNGEPVCSCLEAMAVNSQKLHDAFLTLEQFRTIP